jgi:hypothetical protein
VQRGAREFHQGGGPRDGAASGKADALREPGISKSLVAEADQRDALLN